MVALAPVPPETFKAILEACGYTVAREDNFNWTLVRGKFEPPIILPKAGVLVAIDVLMQTLSDAKIDNLTYLTLKSKFAKPVNWAFLTWEMSVTASQSESLPKLLGICETSIKHLTLTNECPRTLLVNRHIFWVQHWVQHSPVRRSGAARKRHRINDMWILDCCFGTRRSVIMVGLGWLGWVTSVNKVV